MFVHAQVGALLDQHHDVAELGTAQRTALLLYAPMRHDVGDVRGELFRLKLARAALFFGQIAFFGYVSAIYSMMASDSKICASASIRAGTLPEGEYFRIFFFDPSS